MIIEKSIMSLIHQQKIKDFIDRYSKKRVALVHEFLVQRGGAERILEAFTELFPNAPIYTLVYDRDRFGPSLANHDIRTSFIQKIPLGVKHYRELLALMPKAIESFDLNGYQLVLSNCSSFAKGVITRPPTRHFCYCHTPTRFIWLETNYYVETTGVPRLLQPIVIRLLKKMRPWDYNAAQRPDLIIANSQNIRQRIKKIYHRESPVIHPFVNIDQFSINPHRGNYYLIGGRLVLYKRYDLVIKAFNASNKPLVVFGEGQDRPVLEKMAISQKIKFIGRVGDDELAKLYSNALAYIYPGEEDFGIQPLESMASGVPVIALGRGGTLETVIDRQTGLFFDEQTPQAVNKAISQFEKMKFNKSIIRQRALSFTKERFMIRMIDAINQFMSR